MDSGNIIMITETDMKENLKWDWHMEKENTIMLMGQYMRESMQMIRKMEMEFI